MVHCDGLMLCKCADHLRFANLALWNPATRKFRWVDPVDVITNSEYYGIGYSNSKKKARDDGYKIVRFTCGLEGNYEINVVPHVEIYEFKTNAWRTIGIKVDADVKITRKCVAVMGNILSLLQQGRSSRNIEVWVSSKLGDGDVSFSKYFSLSGPGLRPALQVRDDASPAPSISGTPLPKSVIVWFVGVEGKGDKVRNCLTLYEIDEDGVRNEKVTERDDVHEYSRAFVCGYVYVPSLVPLP
ncbi:putative F-box only protein 15 [Brassica rapa]|uniref:putative F-box only protein 15 n=1 Tax=Brassica campestris TaxID=3711 RepID=UPI0004F162D8|nr:putative F-box only protein 15 [Brassica rapa]